MKLSKLAQAVGAALLAASLASAAVAQAPKMKMTTEIPANVITPDKMETSIGTLNLVDGCSHKRNSQKVWDQLDFSRAVEAMIMTTPEGFSAGLPQGNPRSGARTTRP